MLLVEDSKDYRTQAAICSRFTKHGCLRNTLLVEVKTVINSRQLTYVEDDQDGMNYTLSLSHLVNG